MEQAKLDRAEEDSIMYRRLFAKGVHNIDLDERGKYISKANKEVNDILGPLETVKLSTK